MIKYYTIFLFVFTSIFTYAQSLEEIDIISSGSCDISELLGKYTRHTGDLSPQVENLLLLSNSFCDCYNQEGTSNVLWLSEEAGNEYVGFQILGGDPGNGCGTGSGITGGGGVLAIRTATTGECNLEGFVPTDIPNCEFEIIPTYINPIPTISEWGLILMLLIFIIFFTIGLRKVSTLSKVR